jgi:hypothetical protein
MRILSSPKRVIVIALVAVVAGYAFNFMFNPFGLGP